MLKRAERGGESSDIWAVVPVKPFAAAKRRLAPALDAASRAYLAQLMLEDVLDALARCEAHLAGVVVVTSDAKATALAARCNAVVVPDQGHADLNGAIRLGADWVTDRGGGGILVVPSDVPQLAPNDIVAAVEAIATSGSLAVLGASEDGGT
ncbi:MAG: DUF2064 domain-containing protein, partial [Pseudomonadota bacterium]